MRLERHSGSPGFLTTTAVACLATAVACGTGAPPELNGLTDQIAQVGVELKIDLYGTDPDGDQLSYSYESAGLNLEGHAGLSISPSGAGVFRWTPLATEVGVHAFDFTVSDGGNDTTVTITIEVKSAIGAATAPLFRQPLGSGTTLDLSKNECVDLDVLVEDQDTAQVTIAQEDPVIEGSILEQTGGQAATWSWCPTRAQESEDRYTLKLSADDGENPKIIKNYLVVLRSGPGNNCPGNAPEIDHTASDQLTILDVPVSAAISDDKGIKNEPLIYYSTTPPADPPDLGAMTQLSMVLDTGTNVDGVYLVALPNPVATAPAGTSATLYYVIAAKDDDDEVGGCDHTTTSKTYAMKITSTGSANAGLCEPCSHDSQCGSGDLCVRMGSMNDTFCLESCSGGCPSGYSCSGQPLPSVDGASAYQCVPQSGSCDAPTAQCEDDIWEENDERSQASANPSLIANTNYDLVSCPSATTSEADNDWFKIVPSVEGKLTLQLLGGSNTDLDMRLYRSDGTIITSSTSFNSDEQIMTCLPPLTYYVRVFGWGHAKNVYTLSYSTMP
ncbi:MAG: putative Ig domain-containing protein, partial [Kofleriaceae bacterium]